MECLFKYMHIFEEVSSIQILRYLESKNTCLDLFMCPNTCLRVEYAIYEQ